jgi:hypothetical protein
MPPQHMSARRALTVCLALAPLCAACAAGPETNTSGKGSPLDRVKPFESGAVNTAGVYVPSEAERALDCKKLTGSMHIIVTRLRDNANRPQPSMPAAAAQSVISTVRGQPGPLDMDAELLRERGRLTAYNTLLAEKKCATLDLAKELAPAAKK